MLMLTADAGRVLHSHRYVSRLVSNMHAQFCFSLVLLNIFVVDYFWQIADLVEFPWHDCLVFVFIGHCNVCDAWRRRLICVSAGDTTTVCMARFVCRSALFVACLHFICGLVLAALCHSLLSSLTVLSWLMLLRDSSSIGADLIYFLL